VARTNAWDFQLEYRTDYRAYVEPYRVRAILVSRFKKPAAEIAQLLGLTSSEPVHEVLATYDGTLPTNLPLALIRLWVVGDASPALAKLARAGKVPDFEVGGRSLLLQLTERYDVQLAYALTLATPTTFGALEARTLGERRGAPALRTQLLNHDRLGRPVAVMRAIPNAENSRLSFVVRY
jgi:DNA-binding GntR family transcriptional regulator